MTENTATPAPPPLPATPESHGILARVLEHLAPDIADIRIKAENAIGAAQKLAPVTQEAVSIIQEALKILDPAAAPGAASLIARAEKLAAEAASVAGDLAAFGV